MSGPGNPKARNPSGSFKLSYQLLVGLCAISLVVALTAGSILRKSETEYLTSLLKQENQKKFDLLLLTVLENVISEDVPQLETAMNQLIKRDKDIRRACAGPLRGPLQQPGPALRRLKETGEQAGPGPARFSQSKSSAACARCRNRPFVPPRASGRSS